MLCENAQRRWRVAHAKAVSKRLGNAIEEVNSVGRQRRLEDHNSLHVGFPDLDRERDIAP